MKNAKISVMLAGLLVISTFAAALAIAESDDGIAVDPTAPQAVNVEDATMDSIDATDVISIDDDLRIIGSDYRRGSLLSYRDMAGGLENDKSGFLANVGFLSVALVNKDSGETRKVAAGRLQIVSSNRNTKYKLIASDDGVQDGVIKFNVLSKDSRLGNLDDVESVSIGTFTLTQQKSFDNGYSRWTGRLVLNSGEVQGTWEGTFYSSKIKTLKPITDEDRRKDRDLQKSDDDDEQEVDDGVGKIRDTKPMPAERVDGVDSAQRSQITASNSGNARKYWWQFWKAREVEAETVQ